MRLILIVLCILISFNVAQAKKDEVKLIEKNNAIEATREQDLQAKIQPYTAHIDDLLLENWKPPAVTKQKLVTVLFGIAMDGSVYNLKVVESSKDPTVDQAAIEAVKKAIPFDALPVGWPETEPLEVKFTFVAQPTTKTPKEEDNQETAEKENLL